MVQIHRRLDGTTKGVGDSPADDLLVYTLENQHDNRKIHPDWRCISYKKKWWFTSDRRL